MTRFDESNSSRPASLQAPFVITAESRHLQEVLWGVGGAALGSGPSRVTCAHASCMRTRRALTLGEQQDPAFVSREGLPWRGVLSYSHRKVGKPTAWGAQSGVAGCRTMAAHLCTSAAPPGRWGAGGQRTWEAHLSDMPRVLLGWHIFQQLATGPGRPPAARADWSDSRGGKARRLRHVVHGFCLPRPAGRLCLPAS